MSASIATVVTMGYGSFGSIDVLPTIGYGIGIPTASEAPTSPGIEFTMPRNRMQFTMSRDRLHFTVHEQ